MRLKGGRTGKRAVDLRGPRADRADEAVRPRGLVRRAGRRARLQRLRQVALPAAAGRAAAATRTSSTGRSRTCAIEPVRHTGKAKLGARVRPGWFVQTHEHPELIGRTLLEILHRGDGRPTAAPAWAASRPPGCSTATSSRTPSEQKFESLSGGQQARFQILLLELSGATLLLLDEPTDNLDVQSAEALEDGLEAFDGHRGRGHPRPVVRARLRPVPRLRRRRRGLRVRRAGLGRGPGAADAMSLRIVDVDPFDPAGVRRRSTRCTPPRSRHGPAGEFATSGSSRRSGSRWPTPTSACFRHRLGRCWRVGGRVVATGWMSGVDRRQPRPGRGRWSAAHPDRPRPRVRRRDARPRRGARPGRAGADRLVARGRLALRRRRGRRRLGRPGVGPARQGFELALVDVQRRLALPVAGRACSTRWRPRRRAHHEGYAAALVRRTGARRAGRGLGRR